MKNIFSIIIILCLISLAAVGIAYRYAENNDFYFSQINQQIENRTGLTLAKTGALELSLLPRLELTVRGLQISKLSRQAGARILSVETLIVALDWSSILRADIAVDLKLDKTEIDLQIDAQGLPNWQTSQLQGDSSEFLFRLGEIHARQTRFRFRNNQSQEILGLDFDQIDVDFENGQLNTHVNSAGRFGATRFIAQGELNYETKSGRIDVDLNVSASAARNHVKVNAIEVPSIHNWIEQNAESFPISGKIQGELSIRDNLPNGKLHFESIVSTIGDLSYLSGQLTHFQPELGPITASGTLQFNGSDIDLNHLQAELNNEGQFKLDVSGNLQNLLSETTTEFKITGQAERLNQFLRSSPVSAIDQDLISRMETIELNASVASNRSSTRISNIDLHFRQHELNANVSGELEMTQDTVKSRLSIDGKMGKASDLFKLFNISYDELDDSGAFTLNARIKGENSHYVIEQSEFNTLDGQIKAAISGGFNANEPQLSFDLDTRLKVTDFSRIAAIFPKTYHPYVQNVGGSIQAKLLGTRENFSASDLKLDLLKADKTLSLTGEFSHLPSDLTSNIQFRYSIVEPLELEQYFPKLGNLQLSGPLSLDGTLQFAENKIRIEKIQLIADRTDIAGNIYIDLGRKPMRIKVALSAEQFTSGLAHSLPEINIPVSGSNEETETQKKTTLSAKQLGERFKAYTSGIQIDTDWIDQLDVSFDFKAANAQIGVYEATDLTLTIDARDGIFKLVRYELMLDNKPVSFSGIIDNSSDPPAYAFSGILTGDNLETLLNIEDSLFQGGELNGDFSLISEGVNLGELIANLEGKALVNMGPLDIRSSTIDVVSSGIFSVMLGGLMSKKKDDPITTYECGVMGVDIKKGLFRMNKSFTLQAKDYNLAGHGTIDLNTGMVDIKVQPKARKGLGLSVSTLVGGFKVKGNLATPQFGLGSGLISAAVAGYALSPVALGAAANPATATIVATGFLLTGFANRITAANYTCKNTLKRIERRRKEKTSPEPTSYQKRYF